LSLLDKNNHFNIANIVTYINISMGIGAIFFILQGNFFVAIIMAWIGGACDIIDGKLARKFKLSSEFGIQIDSFADFLSFVIMPSFLLFYAIKTYSVLGFVEEILLGIGFVWYIINGLIRLAVFNTKVESNTIQKYFEGVPTPLGAILLWIVYLLNAYGIISGGYINLGLVLLVSSSLNSKIKIPHP